MRSRTWCAATGAALAVALWGTVALAQDAEPAFTSDEPVRVVVQDGTGTATVSLVNPGSLARTLEWDAALSAEAGTVTVTAEPSVLPPATVTNLTLTFATETQGDFEGTLVGREGMTLLTHPLTVLVPLVPDVISPVAIVVVSVLIALILVIYASIAISRVPRTTVTVDPPRWDFDESFATSAAAIGGILTAVAAEEVLTEAPYMLEKAEYGITAMFFGVLAVMGPVVYAAAWSKERGVWALCLGAFVATWAVTGQVLVAGVLVADGLGHGNDLVLLSIAGLLVVAALAAIAIYVPRTLKAIVTESSETPEQEALREAATGTAVADLTAAQLAEITTPRRRRATVL